MSREHKLIIAISALPLVISLFLAIVVNSVSEVSRSAILTSVSQRMIAPYTHIPLTTLAGQKYRVDEYVAECGIGYQIIFFDEQQSVVEALNTGCESWRDYPAVVPFTYTTST